MNVRRAEEKDRYLSQRIKETIQREKGNMLERSKEGIEAKMASGQAVLAFFEDLQVGYAEIGVWSDKIVEIEACVVRPDYREMGIGSSLIEEVLSLSKEKFPDHEIIALGNKKSRRLFKRTEFIPIPKSCLPNQLWEPCKKCKDFSQFPSCHCEGLIFWPEEKIIFHNMQTTPYREETAELYCETWKEPPWNENFWEISSVKDDIEKELLRKNAMGYTAICTETAYFGVSTRGSDDSYQNTLAVCFTWGYEVSMKELQEIAGNNQLDHLFKRRVFYIDELATKKEYRGRGIGKRISWLLLRFVEEKGIEQVVLRTDVKAKSARHLYKSLGFTELPVFDEKYKDRTYWLKEM